MQPNSSPPNDASSSIEDVSGRVYPSDISLHPNTDSASDNETSEKPVREKLKKASIAPMPKDSLLYSPTSGTADGDEGFAHVSSSTKPDRTVYLAKNVETSMNGYHGRAERSQSFDDLGMGRNYETYTSKNEGGGNYAPTRKKSTDIHDIDPKENILMQATRKAPGPEYDERRPDYDAATIPSQTLITRHDTNILPLPQRDSDDLEMGYSMFGPRKKRSRDQLDADIDREQKIVATEEAKAQRRSEEHERDTSETTMATDAEVQRSTVPAGSQSEERDPRRFSNFETPEVPLSSHTPIASSISPVLTIPQPTTSAPPSALSTSRNSLLTRPSTSTTPPSGFAALAGASHSPFSTLGFPSKISKVRPLETPIDDARSGNQSEKTSTLAEEAELNASKSSSPLGFGALGSSATSVLGSSGFSSLGSGVFGTGFGQAFNGGTKLSSFAAPVGDANWGDQGGSTNLFGAPATDEEEDNSESEEYGLVETDRNDESCEVDCRFQQQDVGTGEDGEETVFSSARAGLFSWDGAAWKEGGKGVFKLNLTVPGVETSDHTQRSGRFIMRAHQTFRVLLNTPIFKQMKIGDSKGNEPTSKSLSFSVVEKGKPTPYLIRLNDVTESQTLYQAVRNLQESL